MSWEHTTMGDCLGTPSALGMCLKTDAAKEQMGQGLICNSLLTISG